jgi:hypothetical protein
MSTSKWHYIKGGCVLRFNSDFIKHTPYSEADSPLPGQQIIGPLWDLSFRYRVHKSPPQDPVLSHLNPVHTLTPYCFEICFNIIISRA